VGVEADLEEEGMEEEDQADVTIVINKDTCPENIFT
jgi:hypothetical protein